MFTCSVVVSVVVSVMVSVAVSVVVSMVVSVVVSVMISVMVSVVDSKHLPKLSAGLSLILKPGEQALKIEGNQRNTDHITRRVLITLHK